MAKGITFVCAWCPDAKLRAAKIVAEGGIVTHGICPACKVKLEATL